jgi:hypothetical protein
MQKLTSTIAPAPRKSLNFPDRPFSIVELANWLGVSRRFLEIQIAHGRLHVRRISPRCVRVLPGDVASWLDKASTSIEKEEGEA